LADEVKVCGRQEINFREAFGWLRGKWGVKRLLCEGGGGLNDALFRAGLVDELHLTICPKIFGGRNAPAITDGRGFRRLAKALPLQIKSFKRIGNEVFTIFRRVTRR
jgi:riboflavin biosynthesis pyrimidine reductase